MADRFFKRSNGDVIKTLENQDADNLKSWEDRFQECDEKGKVITAKKKTKTKK